MNNPWYNVIECPRLQSMDASFAQALCKFMITFFDAVTNFLLVCRARAVLARYTLGYAIIMILIALISIILWLYTLIIRWQQAVFIIPSSIGPARAAPVPVVVESFMSRRFWRRGDASLFFGFLWLFLRRWTSFAGWPHPQDIGRVYTVVLYETVKVHPTPFPNRIPTQPPPELRVVEPVAVVI